MLHLLGGGLAMDGGTTRGEVHIGPTDSGQRLQDLLGIGAAMVAVHPLDGKGDGLGRIVTAFIVVLVAMAFTFVAVTFTIVATVIIIVLAVAACLVALIALVMAVAPTALVVAMAMRVTKEMVAKGIEEQEQEEDGGTDAPPGGSMFVAAIGRRHHGGNEPLSRQELIDEHTKNDATADDGGQIGEEGTTTQYLIYNKYARQVTGGAGHEEHEG